MNVYIIRAKQSREIYEFYNKRQNIAQKRYKGQRYEAKKSIIGGSSLSLKSQFPEPLVC